MSAPPDPEMDLLRRLAVSDLTLRGDDHVIAVRLVERGLVEWVDIGGTLARITFLGRARVKP